MKKFALLLAVVPALFAASVAAEVKIAVVDFREVVAKSPHRDAISEKLRAEFKDRIDTMTKVQAELKTMQEKATKDAPTMSEQQKVDAYRAMQAKQADLQLKDGALKEDLKRRETEEQRALMGKINQAVNAVATKEGVQLVLNRDAVPYVQPQLDITEKVVQALSASGK